MQPIGVLVVATLLVASAAMPASAQRSNRAEAAEALFRAGREAMRKGDHAGACEQFLESDRLERAAGTRLNLGLCEEKLGHLIRARDYYQSVLPMIDPNDARAAAATKQLREIDDRIPRVTLRARSNLPPTTSVVEGTATYGAASFGIPLPMDPGDHVLMVQVEGVTVRTYRVVLREGDIRLLEVDAGPIPSSTTVSHAASATSPVLPPPPSLHATAPAHAGSHRALGWSLGGVGAGLLVLGAAASVVVLYEKSVVERECHPDRSCDSDRGVNAGEVGKAFGHVGTVAVAAGAVGLGLGIYLLARGEGSDVRLDVTPKRSGAALTFTSGF